MTLSTVLAAIGGLFHHSPTPPMPDNTKLAQLTQDLTAATARVAVISQQLATATADVATARQDAADAHATLATEQELRVAAEQKARDLQAQLDALPDAQTVAEAEGAMQSATQAVSAIAPPVAS